MRKFALKEIDWPEFGTAIRPETPPAEEFLRRIGNARLKMEEKGLSHLVVYADREHFANMAYLTGFDPRFEEALFILGLKGKPLLIVGNECVGRLPVSPLYDAGEMDWLRYQPFSLLDQPKNDSLFLQDILRNQGINEQSFVGCAGWKYFSETEHPGSEYAVEIPSYIADSVRELAGRERVVNATSIFMEPDKGLRTFASPYEIAFFEYTNILASEGVKNVLLHIEEGIQDYELAKYFGYAGEPLACHVSMRTGSTRHVSMSGPKGAFIRRGEPFSTGISYWGSNICRAGWVASSEDDLPQKAKGYVENFAGPYFEAMSEWCSMLKPGVSGGEIAKMMEERLPYDRFRIFLNPGHLIHLDEWVSSPFYMGSKVRLHSGMVIQSDVIPSSPDYFSTRMEEGFVLAGQSLRKELQKQFPGCYRRCVKRRNFMTDTLGFELPDEVLPLSNIPGIVSPFFLKPNTVFAIEK